ncbi:MAG TPA: amidophosphoribosyltransferase [Acidimicrobiales bacterium]|nr:amidophosphoribosyltransferase [Acidimicrobiales bacterium]
MARADGTLSHDLLPGEKGPQDACGVFGVWAPGEEVAKLTYFGLYALQHRGQEAAGIAVSEGGSIVVYKDLGLVSQVFDEPTLASLRGHLAIGHCRYSTTGSSTWENAQPTFRTSRSGTGVALGHNGNLVNTGELADEAGMLPGTVASDSDLVAELVARELDRNEQAREHDPALPAPTLDIALAAVLPHLQGAFSLVLMDEHRVIGVRDPNGFRPLCLGRLEQGGWVLASESPALDVVGADFVREIEPGEMVVIDADGVRSARPFPADRLNPKLCVFEFVYFARPDTRLYGKSVHFARVRQGELLAEQAPVEADMVMGVPESGIPAAEGYARASGIPYGQGLVKNRYIGRTFIAPSQEMRALGVRMKLNPLKENLQGKRVVVVDDSVVRGTTQKQLVKMLREAGVKEVHLRLTSPPIKWSCFYGIDTGERSELLANGLEIDEIRQYLNLDSIAFITLDRLISSTGTSGSGFCDACFTGNYPVAVPVTLSKGVLEADDSLGGAGCDPAPVPVTTEALFGSSLLPADEARQDQ